MVRFDLKGRQQVSSIEGVLFHITKRKVDVYVYEGEVLKSVLDKTSTVRFLAKLFHARKYTFWVVI